jgi:flagellar hook-associated protein 1 FlgK
MSLTAALNTARSSLATTSAQIAVSGRNVAGAEDPTYTRKLAQVTTTRDGTAQLVSIRRASDTALLARTLSAKSASAGDSAVLDGLNRLRDTIGDSADGASPAARIGVLGDAIGQYANAPDDRQRGQAVVTAAQDVAAGLNRASATVATVRRESDQAIAASVSRVNDLLGQLATLNATITRGTASGIDVTASMDQRDGLVTELSDEMGVSVVQRPMNEIALYTDSGVPLLDRSPRTVRFEPTATFDAATVGAAVYVDGVPVAGGGGNDALRSGRIVGLASVRDQLAMQYQAQIDETARGLVAAFAETDQGGGGPLLSGLFTWSGGPAVPADGTLVTGLADSLKVNAAVDPAEGGVIERLRDGGINGAAYVANASGVASFPGRIEAMAAALAGTRSFAAAGGLSAEASVGDYATSSAGWLEAARKTAAASLSYQETLFSRAQDALSNAVGVNLDDEYAIQLQLERSYAASAKLVGVVSQLFDTLLQTVG